jgi:four helix bundle protein
MVKVKTFRDLIAWQKGMKLAVAVYRETEQMPNSERFGLTMQMRDAATSIPSNVAEGYGRQTLSDFRRFLRVARGSLNELYTRRRIAIVLNMLKPHQVVTDLIAEEDRVLQGLIRSLGRFKTPRRQTTS